MKFTLEKASQLACRILFSLMVSHKYLQITHVGRRHHNSMWYVPFFASHLIRRHIMSLSHYCQYKCTWFLSDLSILKNNLGGDTWKPVGYPVHSVVLVLISPCQRPLCYYIGCCKLVLSKSSISSTLLADSLYKEAHLFLPLPINVGSSIVFKHSI